MRKLLCIPKVRILGFWILFFILVALLKSKILHLFYFSLTCGFLLIGNCVYSIKGRIKRGPYFLSLFALLIVLAVFKKIYGDSSVFNYFFNVAALFTFSYYFLISAISVILAFQIKHLILGMLKIAGIAPTSLPHLSAASMLGFTVLALLYPFVVLHIKRLRDVNLSGWFSLLTLIPIIGFLFEFFLCLKASKKRSRKK